MGCAWSAEDGWSILERTYDAQPIGPPERSGRCIGPREPRKEWTMRIEECLPCPRCGYGRVVQRGPAAYFCFQCRYGWSVGAQVRECGQTVANPLSSFPPEVRLRLVAYRGAIQAGLYTDWP